MFETIHSELPLWLPLLALVALLVSGLTLLWPRSKSNSSSLSAIKETFGTVYELSNLDNRAADHRTPDAIVRIPNGFNRGEPIHLVVYNHGFYTDIRGAYRDFRLAEQLAHVRPNTILFLPEWQRDPGAASGDQGRFSLQGLFRNMVNEAFGKIDALKGLSLYNVERITILGHSAGYGPSMTEIYLNDLESKVVNVTLLDALYNKNGFDRWIKANIKDLSAGRKKFYNFFYNSTSANSKSQAKTVEQMLLDAGLFGTLVRDYDQGEVVMDINAVAAQSLLFKYSSVRYDTRDPHYAIPMIYVQHSVLASDR